MFYNLTLREYQIQHIKTRLVYLDVKHTIAHVAHREHPPCIPQFHKGFYKQSVLPFPHTVDYCCLFSRCFFLKFKQIGEQFQDSPFYFPPCIVLSSNLLYFFLRLIQFQTSIVREMCNPFPTSDTFAAEDWKHLGTNMKISVNESVII